MIKVDRTGVNPYYNGELPPQLAALCRMEINVPQLATGAFLSGMNHKIYGLNAESVLVDA